MLETYDYAQIYRDLTYVSDFNESTSLCMYKPKNLLLVVKREDISAKPIYEALMTISNIHLAKVVYIAEDTDHINIVQEYISGTTLDELLSLRGTLPPQEAKRITADVCDGLYALHERGLVHRDINPNNIIISQNGSATIIDFGIARSFDARKHSDTSVLGTPGYAAPEQFGFTQSDSRTDVYAVGVLLNVMITGAFPNEKRATGALGKIVKKCVEIDSRKRYKSIVSLNDSVRRIVSYNGPADRIIQQIPGLRSKNIFVVIFAFLAYIGAGILTVGLFATVASGTLFKTIIAWIFFMPLPFVCFHNFLGIWDRLPFTKRSSKRSQRITYIAIGIVCMLIGLILLGQTNEA